MHAVSEREVLRLALDSDLTIYTAQAAKRYLLGELAQAEAVEIDLSRVGEFDSAGLQILLLARAEALRAGKRLHFADISPAIDEVIALCRLGPLFEGMRAPAEKRGEGCDGNR